MKKIITWLYIKFVQETDDAKKCFVKRIWWEYGEIYIHTSCRSGVFSLPVCQDPKYIYEHSVTPKHIKKAARFLAIPSLVEKLKLPSNECVYRLYGLENLPDNPQPQQ